MIDVVLLSVLELILWDRGYLQVRTVFLASLSGSGNPYLAANSAAGSSKAAGISVRATLKLPTETLVHGRKKINDNNNNCKITFEFLFVIVISE